MESWFHLSSSESHCTQGTCRLPANFHNSQTLERIVVRDYIYRALLSPPAPLSISDQFAFIPSNWFHHCSTHLDPTHCHSPAGHQLVTNPYVIVIALDFSKAFDSRWHSTLMEKYAALDIPDNIYNWLVDFFSSHSHCTRYSGQTSALPVSYTHLTLPTNREV